MKKAWDWLLYQIGGMCAWLIALHLVSSCTCSRCALKWNAYHVRRFPCFESEADLLDYGFGGRASELQKSRGMKQNTLGDFWR